MISKDKNVMFIIYVKDQEKSKTFYQEVLGYEPRLHVPGMTEFQLGDNVALGIMPETGIMRILEGKIQNPGIASGIPRCEIYIFVDNPNEYYQKTVQAGGTGISKTELRGWGDNVAYGSDPDGHILAFAYNADNA
ncbi:MAG: putative lactoylglutathione lyase [Eubacterium sp.]|jgi:predicted enzyme related to lactoylglutathione lyase|nr:putative lactoylglutathione lyase [Eubacterium sp.]